MGRHIAFFNIPAIGHVFPTLPVVEELTRRGHRVTYCTTEERRPVVEAAGAVVRPYRSLRPADHDPTLCAPARDGYISHTLLAFLEEAEATYAQLAPLFRHDRPDLVVFDPTARHVIHASNLHHTSDYTPYEGMAGVGAVRDVFVRGQGVIRDAAFVGRRGFGQFVERERPGFE